MEINVMFAGSTNVGKTTLLKTYINKSFIDDSVTTLGIDFFIEKRENAFVKVKYNNLNCSFGILQDKNDLTQLILLISKKQIV